jgi:WD40 repeat protein
VGAILTTRIAKGQELARLAHQEWVQAVAFSPDGRWLATAAGNPPGTGKVHLWEAATGQAVVERAYDNWVNSIAFSPDGRWLANGGGDRLVRIWLVQPEALINEACARLTRNLTQVEWQQYLGDEPYRPTCPNLPTLEE